MHDQHASRIAITGLKRKVERFDLDKSQNQDIVASIPLAIDHKRFDRIALFFF